ncbi:MAG: serine hydrolase [Pseudomonadota bacterium]
MNGRKLGRALALGVVLILATACQSVPSPNGVVSIGQMDRAEAIEQLVEARYEAGLFEGAILVAEGDTVLFRGGYGLADRTWEIPNTPETRFHIGSVGKQMTGAVMLQLVHEGKVSPDQTVAELLPEFAGTPSANIRLENLLNHTSGIPNYTATEAFQTQAGRAVPRETVTALFKDEPLTFEPGTGFSYTNSGFFLAGMIIERIEGQHFGRVLQERLFAPLGLEDTHYLFSDRVADQYAEGYNWRGTAYAPEGQTDETWILSNAMIASTVDDMFRWTRALLSGEPFESDEARSMMLDLPEGSERNYAYGIGNVPLEFGGEALRGLGHSGALGGFRASQSVVLEKDWVIIIFSNIGVDQNDMADEINRLLAGEEVALAKPPISRAVLSALQQKGAEETQTWFLSEVRAASSVYDIDEGGMNTLGYGLLGQGRLDDALFVLNLNTLAFHQSPNTFDSLGEVFRLSGNTAKALENYEKALALAPDDTRVQGIVQELQSELSR